MSSSNHRSNEADSSFVPLTALGEAGAPGPGPAGGGDVLASLLSHLGELSQQLTEGERELLQRTVQAAGCEPAAVLALEPAAAVLEPEEIPIYERLRAAPAPSGRGLRPSVVMVMKATRRCNLRCTYCHFWSSEPNQRMPFQVLARATRGALAAPGVGQVEFVWHGGETTLLPLAYYRKALWLQQQFRRPGQTVINSLQTNGTLLSPGWLDFLEQYDIRVGVSLDGPPEIHDRRRLDGAGRPTSQRVREGLSKLQERGIPHGILMVVDEDVLDLGAERLLSYFLEIGVEGVALLNVIPENASAASGSYLEWPRFVGFLRELFHLWWPRYSDRIRFREISDLVKRLQGQEGGICIYNGNCMGGFLTIEPSGDVSACDKYIGDEAYRFGNVLDTELADLPGTSKLQEASSITAAGIEKAGGCPWFEVCHGGCPHDRYLRQRHGIGHDERCCGLADLLADMAEALGCGPAASTCAGERALLRAGGGGAVHR